MRNPRAFIDISHTFDLTVCRSLKSGGDPRFPLQTNNITNRKQAFNSNRLP